MYWTRTRCTCACAHDLLYSTLLYSTTAPLTPLPHTPHNYCTNTHTTPLLTTDHQILRELRHRHRLPSARLQQLQQLFHITIELDAHQVLELGEACLVRYHRSLQHSLTHSLTRSLPLYLSLPL
jgi:hypothetical protein